MTVDFTEVILVVLPENLPCCYRAREGSIRATSPAIARRLRPVMWPSCGNYCIYMYMALGRPTAINQIRRTTLGL